MKMLQKIFVIMLSCCLVNQAIAQLPAAPVNLVIGGSPMTGGNIYCTKQNTWIGPTTDGPAMLPKQCMYTGTDNMVVSGVTRGPDSTTATLQADINAANCGDAISVQAGSNIGTITLPAKNCDNVHFVWIRSTGYSNAAFPAEGQRITPCDMGVASMPNRSYPCPNPQVLTFNITTPASSNGIKSSGGDHYRITGANITRVTTTGVPIYNFVDLTSTGVQTNWIVFDRDLFNGIENVFPATAQSLDTSTTRAIWLGQSNHVAVVDSWFSNFYDTSAMSANGNTDAQCIGGGAGSVPNSGWGVYKFVNNHCEASGEGILLGGAAGPQLTPTGCTIMVNCNLDVPTDFEVRQNYFFKPPQWSNGNPSVLTGTGWPVIKNGFEMKIGARFLAEGNVIEHTWYQAQVGWSWSTAPKNQSNGVNPGGVGTAPTALTNDFTYRFNYSYHVAYGIGLYQSMDAGCASCQAQGAARVSIHDNLIGDGMQTTGSLYGGVDAISTTSTADTTGRGLNQLNDVSIVHNTFVAAARYGLGFGANGTGLLNRWTIQDNIFPYAAYGVGANPSTGGCVGAADSQNKFYTLLNGCVATWNVDHNAMFNWKTTTTFDWPTDGKGVGNFLLSGVSLVGFVNYGTGDSGFNPANYALTTASQLHDNASDGKDVGADIATLVAKIAGVRL